MDKPDTLPEKDAVREMPLEEVAESAFVDRHGYLRPGRYFHFYLLYEPKSRKSCWLPDGYHV